MGEAARKKESKSVHELALATALDADAKLATIRTGVLKLQQDLPDFMSLLRQTVSETYILTFSMQCVCQALGAQPGIDRARFRDDFRSAAEGFWPLTADDKSGPPPLAMTMLGFFDYQQRLREPK